MQTRIKAVLDRVETDARYQYGLLALLTVLAAAVRFYKLGEWSFWGDEVITVGRASQVFDLGLSRYSVSRILAYFAFDWFGISESTARLVPALIGIITIPAIYFPVRRIFSSSVALLTGGFLAISPWHLYWSQNARFYTALLLFYTLGLFAFYLGIEEDRPWYLVLFLVLFGLAIQERKIALFLALTIAGYLVLVKVLPFGNPPGLNLRNMLILLVPSFAGGLGVSWIYLRDPSRWLATFGWINNSPFWILSGIAYYVGIPILCMGFAGALFLLLRRDRAGLLMSLAVLIPLVSVLALSLVQYTANRYVFVSLISWIVLAGVAVREVFLGIQGNGRILVLGVVLILVLHPLGEDVLYFRYQHGNRDNWKAAYAFIEDRKAPGDLIITANRAVGNFYLDDPLIGMDSLSQEDLDGNQNRIWFVEDMTAEDKWPWVHRWVNRHAILVANFDNHVQARNFKMRVYLYDPGAVLTSPP